MRWLLSSFLELCCRFVALANSLEKQPSSAYHARREALGERLQGGVAMLFAAPEPLLDFMPYRQDSDFYYLTGWNEPGAALMVVGATRRAELQGDPFSANAQSAHGTLHRRQDGCGNTDVAQTTGVDAVEPMTELPAELNRAGRGRSRSGVQDLWMQPDSQPAKGAGGASMRQRWAWTRLMPANDVTRLTTPLREVKDAGEIELLKKASEASIAAQLAMMRASQAGSDGTGCSRGR